MRQAFVDHELCVRVTWSGASLCLSGAVEVVVMLDH